MSAPLPPDSIIRRTAPKAGYDTLAKAGYRRAVWDAVTLERGAPRGKVLILPSSEGVEIDVALARGVQPEQLICVDRSAAVIATSRWRKAHPSVRFHAADIASVGAKIAASGDTVEFANLDLCGQVSQETVDQIKSFLRACPLANEYVISITVAKGREGRALATLMQAQGGLRGLPACSRLRALCRMCGLTNGATQKVIVLGEGTYVSGKHPMAWAVLSVERAWPDWCEGELEEIGECFEDVHDRLNGYIEDGERTWVRGEPNDNLREAVYELVSALGDIDFFDLPRAWQLRVVEKCEGDFVLTREQWRHLISLARQERGRMCRRVPAESLAA